MRNRTRICAISEHQRGVRPEWLAETVRECQALLRGSLHAGPHQLLSTTRAFLERLQQPVTPVERLVQRGLLLEAAIQFGHAVHMTFHRQHPEADDSADPCGFLPAAMLGEWPRDLTQSPLEAFRRWASRYAVEFRAAHPLSCAREAERYVGQHFRSALAASELARRLECSLSFLRRTFKQLTGRTLLAYQSELRVIEAMRLLSQSDLKTEAVARDVGYRSKKDLYRVFQAHIGCTPLEYRKASRTSTYVTVTGTAARQDLPTS